MVRLVLVLGDQLTASVAALRAADRARDVVAMAEVMGEGASVPHHPQKIALILAAMRKFAAALVAEGWRVAYTRLDDPENAQTISGELLRRAAEFGATEVLATKPGEWRVLQNLQDLPLPVTVLEDDRFIASEAEFAAWADGRKQLRMEWFYRDMRRKTGLMMEGDQPAGGQWNFDHDNRKPAKADLLRPRPRDFAPDPAVEEVLALVEARFTHFGRLRAFRWATDRAGALQALAEFVAERLPRFGDEQDAMLEGEVFLSHAVISPYLNLGLLGPLEVCRAVENAWKAGRVPIQAAEGFIRQVIGWREFVRGIWALEGPGYLEGNALGHSRALPTVYWGGETRMACMKAAVGQTRDLAYA
ncbi:MAG: cryptochrome/photolyase family protein, partial [Rhodobacterales bacterium]